MHFFSFLTPTHLIGAAVGFIGGLCGYIIVRYWIVPVSRYHTLKRRLSAALQAHSARIQGNGNVATDATTIAATFRRCAADLTDMAQHDLPSWYRISLAGRGEKPADAAQVLMKLANTKHAGHAEAQMASIRQLLKLS